MWSGQYAMQELLAVLLHWRTVDVELVTDIAKVHHVIRIRDMTIFVLKSVSTIRGEGGTAVYMVWEKEDVTFSAHLLICKCMLTSLHGRTITKAEFQALVILFRLLLVAAL